MTNERDRFGEPVTPEPLAPVPHDPRCRNGWLPGGDNPAPCPSCKPWLAACPICGTAPFRCELDRSQLRGRCCPQCPHIPPTRKTRRTANNDQEATA